MNIHFAAFFGVEFDLDILPFWLEHYKKCYFDSYHVILHRESGEIGSNIKMQFKNQGFSIALADGPYGAGILQKLHLGPYADTLPPDDFLVIADADEFQSEAGPDPLKVGDNLFVGPPAPAMIPYHELLKHVDIVTGFMVDRYAHRLETCYMNPFRQYPYEEPDANDILKAFSPPQYRSTEWPMTRRTKVLVARAGYHVAYEGSHCMTQVSANAQIAEGYKVYHFAWRDSAKNKLVKKAYYSKENCSELFNDDISDEISGAIHDNRMQPENIYQM
jgi:hypothetical protein